MDGAKMSPEMLSDVAAPSSESPVQDPSILAGGIARSAPRGIVKTIGVCGGDARIQGTRITVHGLEDARRHGIVDAVILEMYPSITAGDLHSAWSYVESHQEEIEGAISSDNDV